MTTHDPLHPPEPFTHPTMLCPACEHGIDPHGTDPGGACGVGSVVNGEVVLCPCLWSPNDVAAHLVEQERRRAVKVAAVTVKRERKRFIALHGYHFPTNNVLIRCESAIRAIGETLKSL